MALFRKVKRSRSITIQLLACLGFIMLAIYGWGLPVREALYYLLVLVIALVVLIALAFCCGYLLNRFRSRDD